MDELGLSTPELLYSITPLFRKILFVKNLEIRNVVINVR